ncbi:hypothetical protein DCAR_0310852 [Daucus carota subsp. sativus]|uniref:Uncharacterized protein n=1 Tax=Daucus carota subsp. sativus TaxID=79200 RepID=A0AAF1AQM0_DAUCS|nr:hypothetical protein DCAR_0310852 [Daucus carota subsp. sativus]
MANSVLAISLKSFFSALGCLMLATLIYTISIDGLPFRKDLLTPWMAATLIDFYINIVAIGVWVLYKEGNWVSGILWLVLLVCFGSITTCGYIVLQLFKLSPRDSLQDPIYFLLLHDKTQIEVEKKKIYSVVSSRVLFSVLGCIMLGTLLYTLVTDGSPFRKELFTPWMTATLIDFYINVAVLSVWVVYKESSWTSAIFWIVLLVCFGSITTCVYIVWQLFHLGPQDPVSLVLFRSKKQLVVFYNCC